MDYLCYNCNGLGSQLYPNGQWYVCTVCNGTKRLQAQQAGAVTPQDDFEQGLLDLYEAARQSSEKTLNNPVSGDATERFQAQQPVPARPTPVPPPTLMKKALCYTAVFLSTGFLSILVVGIVLTLGYPWVLVPLLFMSILGISRGIYDPTTHESIYNWRSIMAATLFGVCVYGLSMTLLLGVMYVTTPMTPDDFSSAITIIAGIASVTATYYFHWQINREKEITMKIHKSVLLLLQGAGMLVAVPLGIIISVLPMVIMIVLAIVIAKLLGIL